MEYSSFKKINRLEAEAGTSPNKFISLLFGGARRRREQRAANEDHEFYKNYRAYFASTPHAKHATHMGAHCQDQQKSLMRNRLAENAKRILNTKSFDDGKNKIEKIVP